MRKDGREHRIELRFTEEALRQLTARADSLGLSSAAEYLYLLIKEDSLIKAHHEFEQILRDSLLSGKPIEADEKFWSDLKDEGIRLVAERRKAG